MAWCGVVWCGGVTARQHPSLASPRLASAHRHRFHRPSVRPSARTTGLKLNSYRGQGLSLININRSDFCLPVPSSRFFSPLIFFFFVWLPPARLADSTHTHTHPHPHTRIPEPVLRDGTGSAELKGVSAGSVIGTRKNICEQSYITNQSLHPSPPLPAPPPTPFDSACEEKQGGGGGGIRRGGRGASSTLPSR